jgi:prolipoprotein diacylglyceryl transferase
MFLFINWDVSPEIVGIGGFSLRWYSLLFMLGFVIGYFIMKQFFQREKAPLIWLDSLLMYMIIATIIGARLGHCLFYDWEYFSEHPLEIFLPVKFEPEFRFTGFQGLASHGGAIGIIIALWIWSKRISKLPLLWILDRMVIPTALGGAFIRLGNLMNSEITGKRTESNFGFIFKQLGEDFGRYPVQLYESVAYFAIFIFLMVLYWRTNLKDKLGRFFGVFLVTVFSARFALEYYKDSQGGWLEEVSNNALSTGQWLSIPFVLIGLFFILRPVKTTVQEPKLVEAISEKKVASKKK